MSEKRKNLYVELIVELFLISFGIAMLIYSFQPQKVVVTVGEGIKSMTIPRIVLTLYTSLIAIDIARIIVNLVRKKTVPEDNKERDNNLENKTDARESAAEANKKIVATIAVIIGYVILWKIIGFTLSTLAVVIVETKIVNSKIPMKKILIFGVIFVFIVLVVFGFLFNMDFPEPILELIRGY